MQFETKTSVYDLTIEEGEFVLKKIAIKEGATSVVSAGEVFRGRRLDVTWFNQLVLGDMHTSPVIKF